MIGALKNAAGGEGRKPKPDNPRNAAGLIFWRN
jgi:hypothetical protein